MPSFESTRPRPSLKRLGLALALAFLGLALATSDASAQSGGGVRGYFHRFYGQDFYDHQHVGIFTPQACNRQYHGAYYGPAMIYGQQYGDQVGNIRDRPFFGRKPVDQSGYLGDTTPY